MKIFPLLHNWENRSTKSWLTRLISRRRPVNLTEVFHCLWKFVLAVQTEVQVQHIYFEKDYRKWKEMGTTWGKRAEFDPTHSGKGILQTDLEVQKLSCADENLDFVFRSFMKSCLRKWCDPWFSFILHSCKSQYKKQTGYEMTTQSAYTWFGEQ